MKTHTTIATAGASAAVLALGGLRALPAWASGSTHTLHFTASTQSSTKFASFDHDVNGANKIIGYDVVSFSSGNVGNVALATKGGMLYAHLVFGSKGALTGTVTGGTGKYAHATGSIKGEAVAKNKTSVTVTYKP